MAAYTPPKANTWPWWEMKTRKYFDKKDFRDRPAEFSLLADHCQGVVLEVGCCFGSFAKYLPEGITGYLGVDISSHAIDIAPERCPGKTFICGDIFKLAPFLRPKFNTIVMMQLLEHFEKPEIALLNILPHVIHPKYCQLVVSVPRGAPTPSQVKNDGHLFGWKDEGDFSSWIEKKCPFLGPSRIVRYYKGAENHICSIISL